MIMAIFIPVKQQIYDLKILELRPQHQMISKSHSLARFHEPSVLRISLSSSQIVHMLLETI